MTDLRADLEPWGGNDWSAVALRYADEPGWTWIWADLTGVVVASRPPAEPPITTVIWGSSAGTWVRLRVDRIPRGDVRFVGSVLTESPDGQEHARRVPLALDLSSSTRGPGLPQLRAATLHYLDVPSRSLTFVEFERRPTGVGAGA